MNFEFHMPLWAILYCGLIFANGVLTIIISQNRSPLYILGQLLSTAFIISFFFIYYGIVSKPDEVMILILMLLFIFFQEIWINKELYNRLIFEQISDEQKSTVMFVLGVIMLVFLMPFFYVVVSVL